MTYRNDLRTLLWGEPYVPDNTLEFSVKNAHDHPANITLQIIQIRDIIFNSRPYLNSRGDEVQRIPGLILSPQDIPDDKKGKGIIALHQHAGNYEIGKSEVAGLATDMRSKYTQMYGLELALQGYTVLAFDFNGFEERQYQNPSLGGLFGERFHNQNALEEGRCVMGDHVLDTMRGVDVLRALGITTVGVIGHSLGAMVAYMALAADPRIATGVANCGISEAQYIHDLPRVHSFAYAIPGISKVFPRRSDLGILIDRPLLVSAATDDPGLPIAGAREFADLANNYHGTISFHEFPGGHAFPDDVRLKAYTFLEEHLGA